jgi:hypothetical protein
MSQETRTPLTNMFSLNRAGVGIVPMLLLSSVVVTAPVLTAQSSAAHEQAQTQATHDHGSRKAVPARLVELVQLNTRQFIDVNGATAASYQPAFGCVSGPDHGAMGVHYINGGLVGDGKLDAAHPEALIYEPQPTGGLKLVGVEFIVDAATWLSSHNGVPPVLEGQAFQLVTAPNRFGLAAFFELHVWAWRENPNGAFVDWNNQVSCEGQ